MQSTTDSEFQHLNLEYKISFQLLHDLETRLKFGVRCKYLNLVRISYSGLLPWEMFTSIIKSPGTWNPIRVRCK